MLRFLLLPCAFCLLNCSPVRAQTRTGDGRSPFVPMIHFELLDKKFAVGGIEGDAAHEARFQITATTGGMRAGDGTWGEKMVGFRVPIPRIVKGGAGLFGVAGEGAPGAPRIIMTQPLTDENGVARGKVVSGMRRVSVQLAYPNATATPEDLEIDSAWNEADNGWSVSRILSLDGPNDNTYRMSFERDGQSLPIRGHKMQFGTAGLAGQMWRRDYGPDLDGDGQPDGDYITANFAVPHSDAGVLAGQLDESEFERLTRWQPRVTQGKAGVYTSRARVRTDSRFVVDALRADLWDNSAYGSAGNLAIFNEPRALQPRPQRLDAKGPVAPAIWDRATVARLLRDIEKPRSAALLRGLYFGAHRAHALPVKDGRKLLESAAAQAELGSRRWFLLMSLRGFAELRTGETNPTAGFAAYRVLFDNAGKAPAARAQTIVRAAVADFVNMAPIGYDQYKLSDVKGDNPATIAAWKAFSQSQTWRQSSAERADKPLWNWKWRNENIPNELVLYIARQSQSWKNAPLDWRFAAAAALAAGHQQRAVFALWSKLKDELGADDLDRLNLVYNSLMTNLVLLTDSHTDSRTGKATKPALSWEQSAVLRRNLSQERTDRWDFGWAERLDEAPGAAKMRIARQLLARPDTARSRDEIMRSLRTMFRLAFDLPSDITFQQSDADVAGVLARGLLARPDLTREQTWKTRLFLATLLARLGRRPEAAEVLAVPFGAPPAKEEGNLLERVEMARRTFRN